MSTMARILFDIYMAYILLNSLMGHIPPTVQLKIYPHNISSSYILFIYPHHTSSSYILIIHPHHASSSYILIVYPHHTPSSDAHEEPPFLLSEIMYLQRKTILNSLFAHTFYSIICDNVSSVSPPLSTLRHVFEDSCCQHLFIQLHSQYLSQHPFLHFPSVPLSTLRHWPSL